MTVYPCVYREHRISENIFSDALGLSLCVQGTYEILICSSIHSRFIPVCTGNIIGQKTIVFRHAVYPCVYREHYFCVRICFHLRGLSLCVQGTLKTSFGRDRSSRFIPVCTGNIMIHNADTQVQPVYPCVYREHTNYNILFYN